MNVLENAVKEGSFVLVSLSNKQLAELAWGKKLAMSYSEILEHWVCEPSALNEIADWCNYYGHTYRVVK